MPTALIIEDDDDLRETLVDSVRTEGYEAIGLEAGDEALEYLQTHEPPCLLLLDLGPPCLNGLRVLRWVKEQERLRSVRVGVISANLSATERELEKYRGHVVRAIAKPFDLQVVIEMLEQHCGKGAALQG